MAPPNRTRLTSKAAQDGPPSSPCDNQELSAIKDLQNEFKTEISMLRKLFQDGLSKLEEHLNKELEKVSCKYQCRIETLEASVKRLERKNLELEAKLRSSDLIISGIPTTPQENVKQIFGKVTAKIQHQVSPFYDVFRVKSSPSKSLLAKAPPIIVKFPSISEKMHYMRLCKQAKLSLKDIGFASESPVYVTDSLSVHNRHIHFLARKMKREGLLSKVAIKNGFVYVTQRNGLAPTRILEVDDLQTLVGDK